MTPAAFSKAIRKDIPLDNFDKEYSNVKGQAINITKIANDLDKRYTFLYNNYIKDKKMSLEKIKAKATTTPTPTPSRCNRPYSDRKSVV